jgi:hypothetical protein
MRTPPFSLKKTFFQLKIRLLNSLEVLFTTEITEHTEIII